MKKKPNFSFMFDDKGSIPDGWVAPKSQLTEENVKSYFKHMQHEWNNKIIIYENERILVYRIYKSSHIHIMYSNNPIEWSNKKVT